MSPASISVKAHRTGAMGCILFLQNLHAEVLIPVTINVALLEKKSHCRCN